MSSAGTVTGKGFVISYSVSANLATSNRARGDYTVTIDTVVAKTVVWRLGGNGTTVKSMCDIMSNPSLVTQLAGSNGTTIDLA